MTDPLDRRLVLRRLGQAGLVLGTSNAVQQEIPVQNYRAVIEAWKEHGGY